MHLEDVGKDLHSSILTNLAHYIITELDEQLVPIFANQLMTEAFSSANYFKL